MAWPLEIQPQQLACFPGLEDEGGQGLLHLRAQRQCIQGDGRLDHLTEGRQARIQPILSQQKPEDLLIELEVMEQERWLGLMALGNEAEQTVPDERGIGREVRTPCQLVGD